MTTSRKRQPKHRPLAKSAPDPQVLLVKLRTRREKEHATLTRWHKRLLRAFHAYERQHRLIARLEHRIAKLEHA